ncbi:hypothetical protein [Burkholderia gladioli]|uniref:hypothetical protein n=1 Tax=Burkholderia gladioli TaxID=28095 RepID=UPI003F7A69F6
MAAAPAWRPREAGGGACAIRARKGNDSFHFEYDYQGGRIGTHEQGGGQSVDCARGPLQRCKHEVVALCRAAAIFHEPFAIRHFGYSRSRGMDDPFSTT